MSIEVYLFDDIEEFFSGIGESIREAREELEERRHITAVNNYKNDIRTQKDIIISNINSEILSLNDLMHNINNLADKIKKHSNISTNNSTINKKIRQILDKTNSIIVDYTKKIKDRISELNSIESQVNNIYNQSINEDNESILSSLKKSIKALSSSSKSTKLSDSYLELSNFDKVVKIISQITDVVNEIESSNSKYVSEYLAKVSSLLENTDIFNVDSVEQFVSEFNELNKEFKAELLMEKAKSKVESEQQKLQMYFDMIEQVDANIKSVIIQNYIESYNTLKERINTYLDKLIDIESVSISNRKIAIEKKLAKFGDPNTFTRDDYNNFILLIDELELLVQENTVFNAKKALFDSYYEQYKKAAVEALQEPEEITFDVETCDQLIEQIEEATNYYQDLAFQLKFRASCQDVVAEFTSDGFIELKGESSEDEISNRKVFYKKDNPFVAVLVDVTPSSRIIVRTVPLAIKYRGKYVCLENNQELYDKITGNCKKIHREGVKHIVDQTELDEIQYYELSPEAAKEYCLALGIDLSTIVETGTIVSIDGSSSSIQTEEKIGVLANSKDNENFIDK